MYTWNKNNVPVQDIVLCKSFTFCRGHWLFCYLDWNPTFDSVSVKLVQYSTSYHFSVYGIWN